MLLQETYDELSQKIKESSGIDVHTCYQCGKCSAGCPTAGHMDLLPNQILRLTQLGFQNKILTSNFLWTCISCGTCSSRCPKNIDILGLIDIFRNMSYRKKLYARSETAALFYRLFLSNIARHGRLHEVEIGVVYNMKSGHLFKDIELLPELISKGKIGLIPENIKDKNYIKKILKAIKTEEDS